MVHRLGGVIELRLAVSLYCSTESAGGNEPRSRKNAESAEDGNGMLLRRNILKAESEQFLVVGLGQLGLLLR